MNFRRIGKTSLLSSVAFGLGLTMVLSAALPSYAGQFQKNHPRRAEVLHRDNREQNRLNRNRGNLGGHYKQLSREDNRIHQQERADKNADGGHITKAEQGQLNHEENHLNRQIKHYKQ